MTEAARSAADELGALLETAAWEMAKAAGSAVSVDVPVGRRGERLAFSVEHGAPQLWWLSGGERRVLRDVPLSARVLAAGALKALWSRLRERALEHEAEVLAAVRAAREFIGGEK